MSKQDDKYLDNVEDNNLEGTDEQKQPIVSRT